MLLAVDIGNTNISFGIFPQRTYRVNAGPVAKFDLSAQKYSSSNLLKKIESFKITEAIICSVTPTTTRLVSRNLTVITGKRPYIIGKDIAIPLKNLYRKPATLGQDRLVNAYAASILYPRKPLIIIDAGTAITFDLLSKNKTYLGGLIFPGIKMLLKTLHNNTALLPNVELADPAKLIGKSTKEGILSGVVFGTAELCSGLTKRIQRKIGKACAVIGTGGDIHRIKQYSKMKIIIDQDLTLKGIFLIFKDAARKKA